MSSSNRRMPLRMACAMFTAAWLSDALAVDAPTLPEVTVSASGTNETAYGVRDATTATKTDTPIMETPLNVQVVPQALMRDQQAYRLQDVIRNVSGVQSWHAYGGGKERFVIRGFLQSPVNYRNGIRIPLTKFDLANVERVEVLKGPASVLFGVADPGGIVSVVTKRPTAESAYGLEQRVGSFDYYRTELNASGPLLDTLGYRFDLSYLNDSTFREFVGNERVFLSPRLTWQPTAATEINLSFEHYDESLAYDSGIPAVGKGLADLPIERTFTQPGLSDDHFFNLIDLNGSHRFNEHLKLAGGVTAFEKEEEWNEFYMFSNLQPGDRNGDRFAWFGDERSASMTAWLNLTADFETGGVKHKLLFGAEYYSTDLEERATDLFVDTIDVYDFRPENSRVDVTQFEVAPPNFLVNQSTTTRSVFIQDQLTFWDRLHIVGGLRYDHTDRDQSLAYFSAPGRDARSDDTVSPRVGILYRPLQWVSVYANFSEAFGPNIDYDGATDRLFKPEAASQYEGGIKTELFDGRLTSTLAYFNLTKQNILIPDPNRRAFLLPIGQARSQGIEFDVQGEIVDGLSLIGTYAYMETEIERDTNGNQGNRLPYAPRHQGSAWLKYEFQGGPLKGLTLGGGAYASGARYGDAANSYQDEAYVRLDLFGAYRFKVYNSNLTAQLNLNNVSDTKYFNLRTRWTNLPAEPLSVVGSIRLDF